jgi:hypothetical protein
MKKKLFIILSFIFAFTVNAQNITLQTGSKGISKGNDQFSGFQATFSYDKIDAITIAGTEKGTFSALTIAEAFQAVGNYGFPELPEFRKMIQIPVDATPTVKVKNFTTTEINLEEYGIYPVFPMQPSVRKDQTDIPFIYDEKAYGTDDYGNSLLAEVEILGTMRGIILGMVTVRPIQYNPVAHSILAFNNIEIEVSFDNASKTKTEELFVNTFCPYFSKTYDIVYNKGVTRDLFDDYPDLYNTPVRMLVIANRMFEETLQPWLEWKRLKGFIVDLNYTDDIGPTAAQIKTFCHNKYNQGVANGTAPTFIILVGDVGQVPASQTGTYTSKATDLYYARTTTNGFFPNMYYSRMSAQTPQALANQIEKILYYEKYQFADPTYLDNVLLIAGADATWNPRVGQPTINYATNYYYNAAHGYTNIHKYLSSYTGCYANFNNVGFANYTAHCGESSWGDPLFSSSQVNTLTNLNRYFVAMGNCCLAADFGWSGNGGICFGEQMMIAEKKGAVGYIGSSPNSYWGEDFHFAVGAYAGSITTITNPTMENTKTGCYDFMFRDADFNTLCSHVFGGNLSVQYAHNNPGYTTHISAPYYWEAYNVLGDGSLMPYNAQASLNNVSHLPVIYIGLDSYEVTADPGSYVAISKDGVLLGVAVADASGVALVNIIPITSGGNVDIVVTRNQRKPYMVQIPAVAQSGPYLVPAGYTVVGAENLTYISTSTEIEVTLKNVGIATTTGITNVAIACDDPQITFETAAATCPPIAPNETATVKFIVTIANEIVDGKVFPADITITDGSKQTWTGKLSIKAYAPKFSLAKVLIDGKENGSLPKGSLTRITAVIENKGGANAYQAAGELHIEDVHISLACEDIKENKVDIAAGETISFDFYTVTNPNMPSGYEATIELLVNAQFGRSFTMPFKAANTGSNNYCTPGNTSCSSSDRFTSVKLYKTATPSELLINHNPTCATSGYSNHTNIIIPLEPGALYKLDVSVSNGGLQYIKGWFDLNGNNIFENNATEMLVNGTCSSGGSTSYTFTVPQDFVPGESRFRLRCKYNSTMNDACEGYTYGQTLDYTIVLPELYSRVQDVEAELQGKNIIVIWQTPADGTPIGYNIYRNGNKLNGTTPLTNLIFTETDIEQGVYAYDVKAVYTGDKESFPEMSNVVCYTYTCETPKNLAVTAESKTAILTWEKPETLDGVFEGYYVYRDGVKINSTPIANTTYTDANLLIGTYIYQVTALSDLCSETEKTEEVSITILPELCEPPIDVTIANEETTILIKWGEPDPEDIDGVLIGYNVYRNGEILNGEIITETEYRDEEPIGGYYQVSAVYEHCESELSGKVGIVETGRAESLQIFPNPTTGEFTVTSDKLQVTSIEIYDVYGRIIETWHTASLQTHAIINVSHLQSGIYFVKIYSKNSVPVIKQLVIMK